MGIDSYLSHCWPCEKCNFLDKWFFLFKEKKTLKKGRKMKFSTCPEPGNADTKKITHRDLESLKGRMTYSFPNR